MSKSKDKDDDLQRVVREETARGTKRRLPDEDAVKERALRLALVKDLMRLGDKGLFLKVLTDDYELQPGSEAYIQALQAWDEFHRGGRRS
ncbi:MAG: hypothetical protein EPO61_03955 [Nitrospirae bacterium]|nr:MAG: hypothetical protein EPO61_03955 [Nitrospirota bacterium]